jgi:hypothetical protein
MPRLLIVAGALLIALGLLWPWLGKLPLGRLPGDLVIQRPHFTLYFPLTTMILVSAVLTLILWLLRK